MWSVKSGCGARAADCIRSNADQSCIIDWRSEDQMATRSSDEARCRRVLVGSPEHQRSEAPNINGRKPRTSTVGSPEHQRSEAPNINGRKPRTSTVGSPELQRSEAPNINGRKRSAANSPCGFMYGKALFVADAALQPPCVPGRVSSFILMRPFKSRAEMRIGAPDARAATCVRGLRE